MDIKTLASVIFCGISAFCADLSMLFMNDIWCWMYFNIPVLWLMLTVITLTLNVCFFSMLHDVTEDCYNSKSLKD